MVKAEIRAQQLPDWKQTTLRTISLLLYQKQKYKRWPCRLTGEYPVLHLEWRPSSSPITWWHFSWSVLNPKLNIILLKLLNACFALCFWNPVHLLFKFKLRSFCFFLHLYSLGSVFTLCVCVLRFEELTRKLHFANTSRQHLMKSMNSRKRAEDSCLSTCDSMGSNQLVFVSQDSWKHSWRARIFHLRRELSFELRKSPLPFPLLRPMMLKPREGKGSGLPSGGSHGLIVPSIQMSIQRNLIL